MKKSFTIFELILVIIIIGGLAYTVMPYFNRSDLSIAKNLFKSNFEMYKNIENDISNYKIVPDNNTQEKIQETKYWFKKNLQFVIQYTNGKLYYYYFMDLPSNNSSENFDTKLTNTKEIYSNEGEYYIGISNKEAKNSIYPSKEKIKPTFNLSNYSVSSVEICEETKCKKIPEDISKYRIIYFNNNIFTSEGDAGDAGDTVILSNKRKLINKNLTIKLFDSNGNEEDIIINPNGLILN